MPLDVRRILDDLRFLREADREFAVFGANGHEYKLRHRLNEAKVVEFENRYSLRLPDDYRIFLMQVGNGGAGPCYGIYGLDELYETRKDYWNDLSKPFPYRCQWKGPSDVLKAIEEAEADLSRDEDRRSRLIDEYWRLASCEGAINICEYGCNLRFLLIVKGPEFGRIWFDATPDLAGYSPVAITPAASSEPYAKWCVTDRDTPEENRVGFAEWYHCWLDWACRLVKDRHNQRGDGTRDANAES
jgi:hypothetical protein